MHIAFNGWFWDQPFTGSGQYLRGLIGGLRRIAPGVKLSLITPNGVPADLPAGVNGIGVRAGRGQIGKVLFEQRSYPKVAGRIGADIAHVPYWGAPLTSPARLVVTIHDVIPLSLPEYIGGMTGRLYFSLVTASAKGVGHILTDSEFSKAEIIRHIGVPEGMVTAIPLAAGEAFHPKLGAEGDPAVRARYQLPEDGYTLYLGGFDLRKNLRALLAAWTYAGPSVGEQYPLVIAGKAPAQWGTPRFPDIPAEIAARPGLGEWIRWIGPVDETDKPALYRMARAFIFPSRYEGFGLTPLEAMACGTPVVAANVSSIPEVVGEAAYLVDPDDSRQMGGALIAVLIQDDLHDALQNAGLARASHFTWERTATETLRIYEDLLRR